MARGVCKTRPMGQPFVVQTKIGPRCGVCTTAPNRLLGGRITRAFRFTCDSRCGIAAAHPTAHCTVGGVPVATYPMGAPMAAQPVAPQIGSQYQLPGY